MTALWIVLGVAAIFVALHDVFHSLFHPAGRGAVSDWLSRNLWRVLRAAAKRKRERITLAGPFIILAIMLIWVTLVVLGFAFIYRPFMAKEFTVAPGLNPAQLGTFLEALNVSAGGLITLGGDINSKSRVLRLIMTGEAMIGFGLLTACVSWLLSIYPILERRRTLAHEATLLHNSERETDVHIIDLPEQELHTLLWGLAAEISTLRNDLVQFPVTYYFHSGEKNSGLSGALPYLAELAAAGSRGEMPDGARLAAVALGGTIDDYLESLATTFLDMPKHDKAAIMRRYAQDQLREPMHLDKPPAATLRRAS